MWSILIFNIVFFLVFNIISYLFRITKMSMVAAIIKIFNAKWILLSFSGIWFSLYFCNFLYKIPVFNANSVNPDQIPHSVVSCLGLVSLQKSLFGRRGINLVNFQPVIWIFGRCESQTNILFKNNIISSSRTQPITSATELEAPLQIWATARQNQQNHMCAQRRLRPAWVWSVFTVRMKASWVLSYPLSA